MINPRLHGSPPRPPRGAALGVSARRHRPLTTEKMAEFTQRNAGFMAFKHVFLMGFLMFFDVFLMVFNDFRVAVWTRFSLCFLSSNQLVISNGKTKDLFSKIMFNGCIGFTCFYQLIIEI